MPASYLSFNRKKIPKGSQYLSDALNINQFQIITVEIVRIIKKEIVTTTTTLIIIIIKRSKIIMYI
jgi:hypothetical protein